MPESIYDLHCHSTASDGGLKPADLINLACKQKIKTLALTDHDTTNGLAIAKTTAEEVGIQLVPGIEISASWSNKCFHIVGLDIDPDHPTLQEGLKGLQEMRCKRAELIADKLEKYGAGKNIAAQVITAADGGMITRTHFAQYLVKQGYKKNLKDIFKHFLVRGKPGYVATKWAALEDTITWINDAGGVAVVAHPMRYKLSASWMRRFLSAFKSAGGKGVEVVCGSNSDQDTYNTAVLARRYDLAGSVGSDFHSHENSRITLGNLPPLPQGIEPIWSYFS